MRQIGIFVGRMCPVHKGHMRMIDSLIQQYGYDDSLVFIGSSTAKISYRILFSYEDRRRWLKQLYPQLKIMGLPDAPESDKTWFAMLDDYINCAFPGEKEILFIGGSQEDVEFYYNYGRSVHIVNRDEFKCSGTNVRQLLLMEEDISKFVDSRIVEDVQNTFRKQIKKLDELRG